MEWFLKTYDELTVDEFHDILKLRIDIFVVEQNCPYPELDTKDKKAWHFYGKNNDKIIAYTRIFKPRDYYQEAAFGRVVVHQEYRNQKLGYKLIEKTLEQIKNLFGRVPVKIGAQQHLEKFYGSFGFQQVGEPYIEDGIPHIYMVMKLN
ncbi:MAG: GNAT family N-acetyltransferase [Flavobacteriaceae bacterium]|nr:GNAT family N-acetyltransferase [Flavobacteriaceae bacterium]